MAFQPIVAHVDVDIIRVSHGIQEYFTRPSFVSVLAFGDGSDSRVALTFSDLEGMLWCPEIWTAERCQ